jgi:hypothetical protein
MTFVRWKMEHTPVVDGVPNEAETQTYYDIIDPTIRWKLGDSKDTFECKVRNTNNEYNDVFKFRDRLTIYRAINSETFTESDIIFVASIQSANQEQSASDSYIKIVSYSFSDAMMTAALFIATQNRPVNLALQEGVKFLQTLPGGIDGSGNMALQWDDTNPETKSNGQPFPLLYEDWQNRPFRDMLIKYSTNQFTGDGSYTWYVSRTNKLVWKKSDSFQIREFNLVTTPIYSFRTNLDADGIRNYVIVKAGLDAANVQIQVVEFDWESIARYGQKFQILVSEASNAKVFNKQDLIKSYGSEVSETTYPDLSSGFTTAWRSSITETVNGIEMVKDQFVTIPDSGTERQRERNYNAVLRKHVENLAREEAVSFMQYRRAGKLGFEFDVEPGTLGWSLGERVNDIIPYLRPEMIDLRVQEIQYGEDSDKFVIAEEIGTL